MIEHTLVFFSVCLSDRAVDVCSLNRSSLVFTYSTATSHPYRQQTVSFVANTTWITVTFTLEDPHAFWLLDDISLVDTSRRVDVLDDGDFETGKLGRWVRCTQKPSNVSSGVTSNGLFTAHTGVYFYASAPHSQPDYLSQEVATYLKHVYELTFWLANTANSSSNVFTVTISS
jgi:hypothetical protein